MLRLKPKPNPVPNESLKGFLLHDDSLVRETVAYYFHESWSQDEALIPLLLEGCRRFGEEPTFVTLGLGTRFPVSANALLEAVSELERSQPPFAEDWLARAPLELIASHEDLLRNVLSFSATARIERRRALMDMTTSDLWQKLSAYAAHFDESGFERDQWSQLEDLLETVSMRASRQSVLEKIRELDRIASPRYKRSLIELAAAMKLYEVTRILVDLLGDADDTLAEAAVDALGRLGVLVSVRMIEERYEKGSWAFRLYAIGALQTVKFVHSEAVLRSLLDKEDDPALRGRIFDALRFHFSEEVSELMRDEIHEPTSWMLPDELKKALFVHAQVLGRDDSEAEAFRRELDEAGGNSVFFRIPVMEWIEGSDPCLCGSGKRYDACCGKS